MAVILCDPGGEMSSDPSLAPVKRDARVERSRAALRGALLDLLADKALDQITIREISARAGSGYATFFRHYPDKEALLDDIAADEIGEMFDRTLPLLFQQDTLSNCVVLCRFVDSRGALWSALLAGAAGAMRQALLDRAHAAASASGRTGGTLPTDLRITFGVGASIELFSWWLGAGREMEVEAFAAILARLVVGPMIAP